MQRIFTTAIHSAIAATFLVSVADAHPHFKAAGPAPGSVVQSAPRAVRVQFTEDLVLAFSGIELKNKAGQIQKTGTPSLHPQDKTQLIVPIEATLAPGVYTVDWAVVGADTHPQKGSFSFEVKP
jgi:methionine-rich copper-binding protein CopC